MNQTASAFMEKVFTARNSAITRYGDDKAMVAHYAWVADLLGQVDELHTVIANLTGDTTCPIPGRCTRCADG